ncbi:disease resistance protein Pik-2-like [Lolium perenne]|uniref:disease resistance protein Pik-2-like n=1 Tax=Lolium perenne TaxID=4522 RepID=UPI0021F515DC|nr:disease resistance protein RPM1-like [Lolium perenne]
MAGTALSMARSMLGVAIHVAASAAADEMSLLIGVRKDIWFIKDELETMQAFLMVAEGIKEKDMLLKVWAKQVRDLSYNIEDCLGEFMVHVASQSLSLQLMKLKDRHRIAMQIRDLKSRLEEVSSRNTRYNLIDKNQILTRTIDERDSCMEDIRNQSGSNIAEAELVGFFKPKEEVIKLIDAHARNGPALVVCIVGMGGLGKTTLTRKVYDSVEDFSCSAWITVSQSFVRMEFLKDMIKQLFGDEALKNLLDGKVVREENLANHLRKELLEKKYFVVLDDLWNIDDWKWIRSIAFPSSNIKGSRIMVTTRDVSLAEKCTLEFPRSAIYHHEPLETNDAIILLLQKTRKSEEDMKNDDNMRNIVTKIVKKSGRLPLAILTIGGILATRVVSEWKSIYNQLPSELETNGSLEAMRRMVTLSYNNLPSHLKSCFLYLSIFPDDFEIKWRRLVDRWISEGFVIAKAGVSVVDVGRSYLNDLIKRSMIQPSSWDVEGNVKSCRVHDIVRDVMVSIARDEKFACSTWDNPTSIPGDNFRHVAYQGFWCPDKCLDWNHVRSLTVFGKRPMKPAPSVCSPDFRMLRTLDLHDAQFEITQEDINTIGSLRHLKYVNLRSHRGSHVYKLPRSIEKLQGLQTLDIRGSYVTSLPAEITKLHSLRSLRCRKSEATDSYQNLHTHYPMMCCISMFHMPVLFTHLVSPTDKSSDMMMEFHMAWTGRLPNYDGVRVPRGIGNLKELDILELVDIERTSRKAVKELGQLIKLRKLSVKLGKSMQKNKILSASIQKLTSLRSLSLDARLRTSGLKCLHSISSPPPLLSTLHLQGDIEEMPDWVGNLVHLVKFKLRLGNPREPDTRMNILVFRAETFINLRVLGLAGWWRPVRELIFEEGTAPHMERIKISRLAFGSGITGITHLPKLKEISLGWGGRVAKLGVLQQEVDVHPSHPVLQLERHWREHDLGDVVQESSTLARAEQT